ncbi:WD40-repeat-containing domain protein [Xylogone sp. PMI_703]|nr:WD40-repeat-containing domain protein [Xylogone sp. PMI_703]
MSINKDKQEWELPHLRESHQLVSSQTDFWQVKFYPYTDPGVDPVFAVAGGKQVLICRTPPPGSNKQVEVIQAIVDDEPDADHYTCAWTKNMQNGDPLICIAGATGKVKVINALTGELQMTLSGHGGDVNDLAVSPVNPELIASASEDSTVRIWSLNPAHANQPCAVILAGDGHRETVLTISFHANGRYLLSGGTDHIINLWTLPELPDSKTGTNKPTLVHYPHFSTSEVHSDIVDCIAFHHDLILSKAANENCIVLWSIKGFSSSNPPPLPSTAPTTHDAQRDTRSAFSPPTSNDNPSRQYTRLLQFATPDSEIICMRFGLFRGYNGSNPVLAMCNTGSKVYFWDLSRLEEYHDYLSIIHPTKSFTVDGQEVKRPPFLVPFKHRNRKDTVTRIREETPPSEHSSLNIDKDSSASSEVVKSIEIWDRRYNMSEPLHSIQAHKEEVVRSLAFVGRQVAWSAGGEWCIVAGSASVVAVLQRWSR